VAGGIALLYFWLIGHWFARIVMVPIATLPGFLLGNVLWMTLSGQPFDALLGIVLGLASCWFVASLPTYYWRRQVRLEALYRQQMREYLLSNAPVGSLARPTRGGVSFLR